ncbi:hypothetical protein SAMN06269185_2896 [Natronoarchaeum philippinense]|uniref:Uncharacterized protein n=1 Tax=Natronoarchaeum philippinense TaxID=558529 RepID=A0A285P7A2_NATPI|nr:hypothetical protein [Natronoarchaeum philippinense]SNZ17147.1 hypothetical protein SAMN06269185_2896 [Natronoarchaeum philippinense]
MLQTKLLTLVAVTVLLASGVAGAAPAAPSPNDGPPVDVPDIGPPSDLPDVVPDFVGDIHDSVTEHVENGVDKLGERISDLTPGES